jgi:hypothetical protein
MIVEGPPSRDTFAPSCSVCTWLHLPAGVAGKGKKGKQRLRNDESLVASRYFPSTNVVTVGRTGVSLSPEITASGRSLILIDKTDCTNYFFHSAIMLIG